MMRQNGLTRTWSRCPVRMSLLVTSEVAIFAILVAAAF